LQKVVNLQFGFICYLWSEVDAKREACEIGSALHLQLLSLPGSIKHVILYSDACSRQNRNQFRSTALMHAVMNLPNIEIIDHKFLESGHTQMECDSMHSAIEFAKKKTEHYIPSKWATIIRMTRRKNPYYVVPLQYEDIYYFKEVTKTLPRRLVVGIPFLSTSTILIFLKSSSN
jgi:hypothetical protein